MCLWCGQHRCHSLHDPPGDTITSNMLTTLLLTTILLGCSQALQPGLEYHYAYSGRVAMGLPEIRSQFAGAGLDADLYLQVINRNKIMAKLMNVKVGEVHEIVTGDPAERLPMLYSYRNVENASLYLEYPVALYLTKGQVIKMEVPTEEPSWVSNLRVGVLHVLFSLDALKANLLEEGDDSVFARPPTYTVMEEAIDGKCYTEYTLSPLRGDDETKAAKQSRKMTKDIQSTSATSAGGSRSGRRKTIISNKYWELKKNVNYNKCKNKVMLKREVREDSPEGTFRFPSSAVSRSLYGSYVLQGGANGLRVESAMLESTITLPGVSGHMEKLHTITNQSLSLESVEDIMVKMKPDTYVNTLNYQYLSNYEDFSRQFEEFLFGIDITNEDKEAVQNHVLQLLRSKLAHLENPEENTVKADHVAGLVEAVEGLRLLDAVAIREVYQKLLLAPKGQGDYKPQLLVFCDMMVMCGTEASIKVLLHIIDEADSGLRKDLISDLSQALISDVHNPAVLRQIMEYSVDLSFEKEATAKSELLLSWSHMFHRLCVPPSSPTDDTNRCASQTLLDIFIPTVHQAMKRSTSSWQKQVYVQSLSNLGHPRAFKHLQTLVENKDGTIDARLRVTAVMGLNGATLTPTLRKQAVDFLSGMVSDLSEDDIVRQAAFLALLTWEPQIAVVQSVAESTWAEASNQVATFITQTLYSLAKLPETSMGSMAARAVPLAKPARFNSLNAVLNSHLLSFLPLSKPSSWSSVVFLANTADIFPQDLYEQLQGLCLQQVSTVATTIDEVVNIATAILSMRKDSRNGDTAAVQAAKTLFNNIKDKLLVSIDDVEEHIDVNMFGRIFKALKNKLMLPSRYARGVKTGFSKKIDGIPLESRRISIQMLSGGSPLVLATPTALGMPHLVDYRTATLVCLDATLNFHPSTAQSFYANLTITVNKMSERRSRSILPWSGKALGTGVTQSMALTLPLQVDVTSMMQPLRTDIVLHANKQQFELLGLQSVPYTCITSALPVANNPTDAFKIIVGEQFPVYYEEWNPLLENGLSATQLTEADYADPLITVFKRLLSANPLVSPASARFAKSVLTLDMDTSAITFIEFHVEYDDEHQTFTSGVHLGGEEPQSVTATLSAGDSAASGHGRVTTEYQIKLVSKLNNITQSEVCLGLVSTSPAMLPLDNIRDLLSGDVRTTLKAQLHPNCPSQDVLIEADVELRLSEFQAAMLHNDLDARATFSGNMLARYLLPVMLYDTAYATVNWTQTAQNEMTHYANKVSDWFDDTSILMYDLPNFRPDSTIRELNFDGTRKSLNGGWHGMAHVSGSELVVNDLQLPRQVMKVLAHLAEQPHLSEQPDLAQQSHLYTSHLGSHKTTTPTVFRGLSTHTCTIKQAKVETYDGYQYEAAPSSCWSVAAMSLTNSSSSFALQVKTEGNPMARLILPQHGNVIIIMPHQITLNSEVLSFGATETHITGTSLRVSRLPGGSAITNADGLMVKVTKSINIKVPISSSVGGLCGNNDGVLENDLVGPRGCIFTSGSHLSMAWMDADESCVPDTYLAQQQETQLIQTYCPKDQAL